MHEYKDNFQNAINFAISKLDKTPLRMILLGALASVYVGIAYLVFMLILGTWPGVVTLENIDQNQIFNIKILGPALFTAACLFPVGILLILFLGGSLFTSDCMTMIAWIIRYRDENQENIKIRVLLKKWTYTLIGNFLGGIFFGAITRGADFLASPALQYLLGYLCGKKIAMEWYFTIFSGFLCNILVAGSVWATFASKHSSAKIFLIYFPIWLFAISGFQHVVANSILFSISLFYMISPIEQETLLVGINFATNHDAFKTTISEFKTIDNWTNIGWYIFLLLFNNLLPATIGNWISGSLFLPYSYYFLSKYSESHKKN